MSRRLGHGLRSTPAPIGPGSTRQQGVGGARDDQCDRGSRGRAVRPGHRVCRLGIDLGLLPRFLLYLGGTRPCRLAGLTELVGIQAGSPISWCWQMARGLP